jgi:hypothetical protein
MNNDYLFEKTGSDENIEELEDLLAVYRIDPLPPALARAESSAETTGPHRLFGFLLSHATAIGSFAFLTIIAVTAIAWLDQRSIDTAELSSIEVSSPIKSFDSGPSIFDPSGPAAVTKIRPQTIGRRRQIKFNPAAPIRKIQLAKVIRRAEPAPQLSAEEKYAYEQVKLALWLAGSKMKVVQDTIDRTGDSKEDSSTDKR